MERQKQIERNLRIEKRINSIKENELRNFLVNCIEEVKGQILLRRENNYQSNNGFAKMIIGNYQRHRPNIHKEM